MGECIRATSSLALHPSTLTQASPRGGRNGSIPPRRAAAHPLDPAPPVQSSDGNHPRAAVDWQAVRLRGTREDGPTCCDVGPASPRRTWKEWEAARTALADKNVMENRKTLPADYKHRAWLPQRPTLKKTEVNAGK